MRLMRVIVAIACCYGATPATAGAQEVVLCFGREATIVGTDGDDTLVGTPADDVIVGYGGDDTIRGLGGNDRLCGRAQSDRVFGGAGDDQLGSGSGHDRLFGGLGEDLLKSPSEETAGIGNFPVIAMYGGPGNDWLEGGVAQEVMAGGSGNDRIVGGDGDTWDTLSLSSAPGPMVVDLGAGTATGQGDDSVTGIERVDGSRFADSLIGGDDPASLFGGYGDDRIEITQGSESFASGDVGNDFLVIRTGELPADDPSDLLWPSSISGGDGDDTLRGSEFGDDIYGGPGDDFLDGRGGVDLGDGEEGTDRCEEIERARACER